METSILSSNIRYLRKLNKFSQEQLASKLGTKRSNIAAYESKNVEPRLRIVLEIARLFDVDVRDLISTRLEEGSSFKTFESTSGNKISEHSSEISIGDKVEINAFIKKSMKIKKVLEGFRSFYNFKKSSMQDTSEESQKLVYDIDNFLQLMEHLLSYNEAVIKAISVQNESDELYNNQREAS